MTRRATLEQVSEAREAAEIAIGVGADRYMWPMILLRFNTEDELEAFRVALLLKGKDTRSARRSIQERKDVVAGLREDKPGGGWRGGQRGRPRGSKDRKRRKSRITPGGPHA